jgi:hypothetical protein
MSKIEIFVHDGSDDYEYDFGILKGYWDNIYVKKNDKIFRVNIITLERLTQECHSCLQWAGCYISDPNLVVVEKATKKCIIKTLLKQDEMGFFEHIAQCDNNGEIVYLKSEDCWIREGKNTFNLSNLDKIYS